MELQTIQYQKKINPKGYILIKYNGEYILEHRLIMQFYLNRELKPEEKVHHDNFCKTNNFIDNLTLFPNTKRHSHFHRQIKQHGYTNPRRHEIEALKQIMELERKKNTIEVVQ
jgi:hypothetical protein